MTIPHSDWKARPSCRRSMVYQKRRKVVNDTDFSNLVNELHEKTSLIITTNKSPKEWADVLKDTILTTALLDRILHRCEIIKLSGNSYRMKNRKTIFNKEEK